MIRRAFIPGWLWAILLPAVLMVLLILNRRHGDVFSLRHPEKLTRITLLGEQDTTILLRKGTTWITPGGDEVRSDAIRFLLYTMKHLEIKSPVSGPMAGQLLSDSSYRRCKIKFIRGMIPVRRFTCLIPRDITHGYLLRKPGHRKFYRIYLPGEEGTPLPFTAISYYWRNHHVFRYLPGEVTRVSLRVTNKKNKSFTVGKTARGYFFEAGDPDASLPAKPDTGRIERYLTYFQSLDFDEFAFQLSREEKDSILKSPPRYEFRIKAGTSDSVLIVTYPMIRDTIEGNGTKPREDPDLTWAWVEPPGELVILKYYRIDPWIKEPEYFFHGD